ncbi:MAG: NAD(+)/NADH kinase [Bacilli bacterium]|nr:NAD(+)/NADH kinase [Bacilli bacterium]
MIKNFKLFVNNNDISIRLAKVVRNSFIKNGFKENEESFDLGIAIGGDGSFLRMIRNSDFDKEPYYVGINSGTLGFLQEANEHEINRLINDIQNSDYKLDEMYIGESDIIYEDKQSKIYFLNEIIIRDELLKTARFDVFIDNNLLETFTGDGLLIATTVGSTGHNLSYGGSIVYSDLPTLQITPIAPINSKAYTNLTTSIILPSNKEIMSYPIGYTKDLLLTIDGEHTIYKNVYNVNTYVKDKKIKCLRFKDSNFSQKVSEKLLSK